MHVAGLSDVWQTADTLQCEVRPCPLHDALTPGWVKRSWNYRVMCGHNVRTPFAVQYNSCDKHNELNSSEIRALWHAKKCDEALRKSKLPKGG